MSLVEITNPDFDILLDIAYASSNNFTGKPVYKKPSCFLHGDAAKALLKAMNLVSALGYKIKIFDGFRPLEAQQALWDHTPEPEFISPPETGRTPHCRGIAVDLTLVSVDNNQELDMGTDFDEFTALSHHGNTDISVDAQKNRHILMGVMTYAGWDFNPNEWWHYQLPDLEKYPKLSDQEAKTFLMT